MKTAPGDELGDGLCEEEKGVVATTATQRRRFALGVILLIVGVCFLCDSLDDVFDDDDDHREHEHGHRRDDDDDDDDWDNIQVAGHDLDDVLVTVAGVGGTAVGLVRWLPASLPARSFRLGS